MDGQRSRGLIWRRSAMRARVALASPLLALLLLAAFLPLCHAGTRPVTSRTRLAVRLRSLMHLGSAQARSSRSRTYTWTPSTTPALTPSIAALTSPRTRPPPPAT